MTTIEYFDNGCVVRWQEPVRTEREAASVEFDLGKIAAAVAQGFANLSIVGPEQAIKDVAQSLRYDFQRKPTKVERFVLESRATTCRTDAEVLDAIQRARDARNRAHLYAREGKLDFGPRDFCSDRLVAMPPPPSPFGPIPSHLPSDVGRDDGIEGELA